MLESCGDVVVVELRKLVVTPVRRLKQQKGRNANPKMGQNLGRRAVVPLSWTGCTAQAVVPLGIRAEIRSEKAAIRAE